MPIGDEPINTHRVTLSKLKEAGVEEVDGMTAGTGSGSEGLVTRAIGHGPPGHSVESGVRGGEHEG